MPVTPTRNIRIELSLYNRIAARAQEQRRSATQVAAMLLEGALAEPVRGAPGSFRMGVVEALPDGTIEFRDDQGRFLGGIRNAGADPPK